jgi:hypothetical protein
MSRDWWRVLAGTSGTLAVARPASGLVRGLAIAPAVLLLLAGTAFWWRRLGGALTTPLPWHGLLAVGLFLAALAALARRAGPALAGNESAGRRLTLECLVSASVVCVGVALSLPGTGWVGLVLCWAALAAEECWAWQLALRPGRAPAGLAAAVGEAPEAGPWSPDRPTGDVIQQIARRRAADGREALSGWLRVPLAAGQRSASVHVAFCPPLQHAPRMTVEQREGPAARIRAVQVLPYGARLDVKLTQPSPTPIELLLEFTAQAAGAEPGGNAPSSR